MKTKTVFAATLVLFALAIMAGCKEGDGPNDPVVSGKSINDDRAKNLTPEELQKFNAGVPAATGAAPSEGGKR